MISRLFNFSGRLDRLPFAVTVLVAGLVYWGTVNAAFLLLPSIVAVSAPLGINGALVLNGIFGVIALITAWVICASVTKRLHDGGFSRWWALLAVPALVAGLIWLIPYIGPEIVRRIATMAAGTDAIRHSAMWIITLGMGLAGAVVLAGSLIAPPTARRAP